MAVGWVAAEPAPVLGAAASAAVDRFPRATRIAGAVGAALRELGLSKHESASASASLLEFTKELFLDEWMSQIEEGEDSEAFQQLDGASRSSSVTIECDKDVITL